MNVNIFRLSINMKYVYFKDAYLLLINNTNDYRISSNNMHSFMLTVEVANEYQYKVRCMHVY